MILIKDGKINTGVLIGIFIRTFEIEVAVNRSKAQDNYCQCFVLRTDY